MIGIYKITNKLNQKSYVGQSIHCGKRLDEHCKGINTFNKEKLNNNITFPSSIDDLKQLKYSDTILAWYLIYSNENILQKKHFTYKKIAEETGLTRQTASSRFKHLINRKCHKGFLIETQDYCNQTSYQLSYLNNFQYLDKKTVEKLIKVYKNEKNEELIKTLVYILEKKQVYAGSFSMTTKEIIKAFGHSIGNTRVYERIRANLKTLQDAGIIKFKINSRSDGGMPQMYVYYVSDEGRASDEWLGVT